MDNNLPREYCYWVLLLHRIYQCHHFVEKSW